MDGQEVFKFAVKKETECIHALLAQAGLMPEDIDWYLLHQANQRIIASIARKLKLSLAKFPSYLPERKSVQMKLQDSVPGESLEKAAAEFEKLTGCSCAFMN